MQKPQIRPQTDPAANMHRMRPTSDTPDTVPGMMPPAETQAR